jgi:hypothetical protein
MLQMPILVGLIIVGGLSLIAQPPKQPSGQPPIQPSGPPSGPPPGVPGQPPGPPSGRTHYFVWKQPPDPARLQACVADMKRILDARPDDVAGPNGLGEPQVAPAAILFNGPHDRERHEPFFFPGKVQGVHHCKANTPPYDAVVTACLLAARDHFPPDALEIGSDRTWGDWADGARLYTEVLGRHARNPLPVAAGTAPEDVPAGKGRGWGWVGWTLVGVALGLGLGLAALIWLASFSKRGITIATGLEGVLIAGPVTPAQRERIADFIMESLPNAGAFRVRGSWRPGRRGMDLTFEGELSKVDQLRLQTFLASVLWL